MKDILAQIVEKKKDIVAEAKRQLPLDEVKARITPDTFRMSKNFKKGDWNLIAECKLQSPAKGRLNQTHSVEQLAKIYAANGASMLSVHTDPHFLGCNEDFSKVRKLVDLPLLRKDFVIDEYQLYEARMLGADAVLLIARILSPEQLKEYLYTAWSLGMDALVEVHDEADMAAALATPAEFIGINNRNLKTFTTSIEQTMQLLPYADKERVLISESGVFSAEDAKVLREAGCDGILVGEGLVRAGDIGAMTNVLANIETENNRKMMA
ncbi:indole-3-glycerol phosphate synthase [Selenomonas sp. GACV-9]|uniref:indole-3-glycerol phosphate synthase TrpC n=1 Tax=Selenomonas sp. GACV-9 TaxID=3158782 RepID=UPI0008E5F6C1|nr:indole-3-glycerol phosphate synthase [Selenomonas ruminantium]